MENFPKLPRRPRVQQGQRIETPTAFHLRYYVTTPNGQRKKVCVKLADKSDLYQNWDDVKPIIERELECANSGSKEPTGTTTLETFVEDIYLPWTEKNKAAATHYGYKRMWFATWKPRVGRIALASLKTATVTAVLTSLAETGIGRSTLGHTKWFLSGVYEYAVSEGVVPENPVIKAKWNKSTRRPSRQKEYSLAEIQSMLDILEPLDLRAAVALALAYFAALRPAEIRGLKWEDWTGEELQVRRSVWRGHIGETKTEGSAASVPVIQPLRGLLERLRAQHVAGEYILQNSNLRSLSLDWLNHSVIAPAVKKAGIDWRGYYPGRRGISSLITDTSKNALNSTGLLRHTTPITALKHYTRAQKGSIAAALRTVEEMARKKDEGSSSLVEGRVSGRTGGLTGD